jgi:hypothetical protein
MAELKTYTKLALEPFESYGLTPLTVTAVTDQGCSVSLELCVTSTIVFSCSRARGKHKKRALSPGQIWGLR